MDFDIEKLAEYMQREVSKAERIGVLAGFIVGFVVGAIVY